MYKLGFDAFFSVSTTTDLILFLAKEFEGVSEVAGADIVVGDGNVGFVEVDDAVPPTMGDKDDVSGMGCAFHGTLVCGSFAVLFRVFLPILYDPFAHRKRECYLVTIRRGKNARGCAKKEILNEKKKNEYFQSKMKVLTNADLATISILTWFSWWIKDPSFATPNAGIPRMGGVGINVKDTSGSLWSHNDPCVIGSLASTQML